MKNVASVNCSPNTSNPSFYKNPTASCACKYMVFLEEI